MRIHIDLQYLFNLIKYYLACFGSMRPMVQIHSPRPYPATSYKSCWHKKHEACNVLCHFCVSTTISSELPSSKLNIPDISLESNTFCNHLSIFFHLFFIIVSCCCSSCSLIFFKCYHSFQISKTFV